MKHRIAATLLLAALAYGDAGIIIPADKSEPDPKILSLGEMDIDVVIDNQVARVRLRQIFHSHAPGVLEGRYVFALPSTATVSDFAVWDDVVRIPGVILERRRANEIYDNLRWQMIDPGLLQMGEQTAAEARRASLFSARIFPIPGFGAKRLEIEYHETIPVEELKSFFAIPLRPDAYRVQTAGRLAIRLDLRSRHPLKDFQTAGAIYPLQIAERSPNRIRASFSATNVNLSEDFALRWEIDPSKPALEILTHRETAAPGFFEASLRTLPVAADARPRTIVALFDTSVSMQWEKLDRAYRALETLLRGLRPEDRFSVILFDDDAHGVHTQPVAATPEAVDAALEAVKKSRLRGGTNLQAALRLALSQSSGDNSYIVLLGDGGATRGAVANNRLASWYASEWRGQPAHPRTYVFGIGDDANLPLLKLLARQGGVAEWVRSTEPVDFKLQAFLAKVGRRPIENLRLTAEPASNFDMVYPLEETPFPGSVAQWVGQYKQPLQARFAAGGQQVSVALPATNAEHQHLPRLWARARVDALLEKIDRDGEDTASIDEIIQLSRKYKFVTPYTSFLAAPRSLLRPRLIRPGDPVLRVRTDESVVSVVAMFPFGLVKPLKYLDKEDMWQTRFLAPKDMADGAYSVRLILRDKQGRVFRESKTFVIASKPPVVRVWLDKRQFHRGETISVRVGASQSTRTIVARMQGALPASLRWDPDRKANTGSLLVPAHLAAGRYKLTVTAEDFAHNIGSQEVSIEVLP